jgi:hypothetical protein
MTQVAAELLAHGEAEAGRQMARRTIAWFTARGPDSSLAPEDRYNFGQALVLLGEDRDARAVFEVLARERPASADARGILGFLAARMGDQAAAQRAVDWLGRAANPSSPGLTSYYLAAISAVRGDTATALDLIERLPGGSHPHNFLQFHIDPLLAGVRNTERFQRFLRPRG